MINTDYTTDAYTPGVFWRTENNNATKPKAGVYLQTTNSGTKLMLGTSNNYSTGITHNICIDPSGQLGVGTTAPQRKLHVSDASHAVVRLSDTGAATDAQAMGWIEYYRGDDANRTGWIGYGSSASEHLSMWNQTSSGGVLFGTANTNRLTIDSSGKVGIGETAPEGFVNIKNNTISPLDDVGTTAKLSSSNPGPHRYGQVIRNCP